MYAHMLARSAFFFRKNISSPCSVVLLKAHVGSARRCLSSPASQYIYGGCARLPPPHAPFSTPAPPPPSRSISYHQHYLPSPAPPPVPSPAPPLPLPLQSVNIKQTLRVTLSPKLMTTTFAEATSVSSWPTAYLVPYAQQPPPARRTNSSALMPSSSIFCLSCAWGKTTANRQDHVYM